MPLTLPDGLQRTKANGADLGYLWVGCSTRERPREGAQLIHELA
jgi:hypothetical protein